MPTRFKTTSSVVVPIMPNPRPPFSMGRARYGGIQLNRPHQANNPKRLSRNRKMADLRRPGAKISEKGALSFVAARCSFHISDSGTLLLIHNVTSAGRMPTKNTKRQFWVQLSTIPLTNAAAARPQAHELCTSEMAFARKCVGQVSATRVAPVFHSPPIPSPRTKRKKIKTMREVESPEPREHIE